MSRSQRFPAKPRACVWCGRMFTPPEKGKKAENCQPACRKRAMWVLNATQPASVPVAV